MSVTRKIATITSNNKIEEVELGAEARNVRMEDGTPLPDAIEPPLKSTANKDTPTDADSFALVDSADGSKTKRVLWSRVKAVLKGWFDTLYAAIDHTHTAAQVGARPDTWTPAWGDVTGKPSEFPPSGGPYLPLSGGTMTGDITLGRHTIRDVMAMEGAETEPMRIGAYQRLAFEIYSREALEMEMYDFPGDITVTFKAQKVTGLPAPTDPTDAANKGYVDEKILVFTDKTIEASAWVSDSTYSAQGYGFRAAVACAEVTASHRPDVAFGAADTVSGNFAPFCKSYAGGVYIYCKNKPKANLTIPSILCIKVV